MGWTSGRLARKVPAATLELCEACRIVRMCGGARVTLLPAGSRKKPLSTCRRVTIRRAKDVLLQRLRSSGMPSLFGTQRDEWIDARRAACGNGCGPHAGCHQGDTDNPSFRGGA
jgi:hypothetical protein